MARARLHDLDVPPEAVHQAFVTCACVVAVALLIAAAIAIGEKASAGRHAATAPATR